MLCDIDLEILVTHGCGGDAVVTGAGQRVSQMTTIIAPILSSFAIQTWQSMGTLLDEQLRLKNNHRTGDGAFFNRGSQVKFSTFRTVIASSQQDTLHSEKSPHDN
jgi:hypothetical protein